MSHQQPRQSLPVLTEAIEPVAPFITDCHRVAIDSLGSVFAEARPLAILIGEGKSGASFVIGKFIARIDGDVTVARICEPCSNAIEVMREIVSAAGFDPKDMNLADLEKIFEMFLMFQQRHNRRTIVCLEETQDNGRWVLDRIRRLVELEMKNQFGLLVILSGRPSLNELLDEPPLNAVCGQAGQHISLAAFTLAETKEYIRRRVEAAGTADIGQVFEFDAVTAIQALSSGVPDAVSRLCSKCLELAELEGAVPVTTALVNRAGKLLRLASVVQERNAMAQQVQADDEGESHAKGRLIAYLDDAVVREQSLNGGHVLIGRDELCDFRLSNIRVSRLHALVVDSSIGVKLVDLGSKNGTFVNGRKIKKHTLQGNDKITVGDCSIEFIAAEDHRSWYFDVDPTESFEPYIADSALLGKGNGQEMPSVDAARTVISHRYSGARPSKP